LSSKKEGEKILKALENLRNELAHAQDIIKARWPELVTLARKNTHGQAKVRPSQSETAEKITTMSLA